MKTIISRIVLTGFVCICTAVLPACSGLGETYRDVATGFAGLTGGETPDEADARERKLASGNLEPHREYILAGGGDLVDPVDSGGWTSRAARDKARKARDLLRNASEADEFSRASSLVEEACGIERTTAQKHVGLITQKRDQAIAERQKFPNGNEALDARIDELNRALAWFQQHDSNLASVRHPYGGRDVSLNSILAASGGIGLSNNSHATASTGQ